MDGYAPSNRLLLFRKTAVIPLLPTVEELRKKWYGQHVSPFEPILDRAVNDAHVVLVFGAGRGAFERDLRAPVRLVIGVDVDSAIRLNPYLDHSVLTDGLLLPFRTGSFDLCIARWVIEHVPTPRSVFHEIARVLRPGGKFVFITTNAWFYAAVLARLTPNPLHGHLVKLATGRDARDTFRTYYRANTRRKLQRLMAQLGFREEYLRVELGDPDYLRFSLVTYSLGTFFHRLVNSVPLLEDLGQAIVGSFVRVS